MKKEDIIQYSQQIVLYKSDKDYSIANGFFVKYFTNIYFVTANHAIEAEYNSGNIHLILHIKGEELTTQTLKMYNLQYIDLYEFSKEKDSETLSSPILDHREDFAFCGVIKETLTGNLSSLNYFLKDAEPLSCHDKKFECIQLPQQMTKPTTENFYFLAGKILKKSDGIKWEYKDYFYFDMKYIRTACNIYEFQIQQPTSIEHMAGLSGSPVFDENSQFVGMAIRYIPDENKLLVFPAEDIEWYLRNDYIPSQEEIDYYNE